MFKRYLALGAVLFLAGCGSSSDNAAAPGSKLAEAQACFACHGNAVSPGTGANIITEWKASVHNTSNAASCVDCHEPQNHPNNLCSTCHNGGTLAGVDEVQRNPDKRGKCLKCHNGQLVPNDTARFDIGYHTGLTLHIDNSGIGVNTQRAHFNNSTSSNYPGSFVSSKYLYKEGVSEGACRKCHNPHDTTSKIQYNRDWARAAHGSTPGLQGVNEFWVKAREEYDFKTAGSSRTADQALSDNTSNTFEVCVRCHTTTGYINYVQSGFKNVQPFAGPGYAVKTMDAAVALNSSVDKSRISPDKSKELTNCNACHDSGNDSPYSFRLRKVNQVTTYYNYSGKTAGAMKQAVRGYGVTYPDYKESNMCVACHSGRLVGNVIKMADARGLNIANAAALLPHFRGSAATMAQVAAFNYYTSAAMYASDIYSHKYVGIGVNPNVPFPIDGLKADSRGYGPCIGCHMNSNGTDTPSNSGSTSHTFMPVNRDAADLYTGDANAKSISKIVSKACSNCHSGAHAWTPASLQQWKDEYKAGVNAFLEVAYYALNKSGAPTNRRFLDSEGRPGFRSITNWSATSTDLQDWLKTGASNTMAGSGFVDPVTKSSIAGVRKAAYTMGAVFNYFVLYYDPGAYAHNNAYVKRMIYDSIDWLDDGVLNSSVSSTFNNGITGGDAAHPGTTESLNLKTKLDSTYGAGTWDKAFKYLLTDNGEDLGQGRPAP